MSYHPFRTFIDLITYDQVTHNLEMELQKLEQDVNELKDKEYGLRVALDEAKNVVHDIRKEVDMQELSMKEFEQSIEEKTKRRDITTDPKVYQVLKSEIDRIKQKQHNQEEDLVKIWNKLEAATKDYEDKSDEYGKKIELLRVSIYEKNQKIDAIKLDLQMRYDKRPEMQKNIPEEWLEKYSLMRSRVSNPVVPVLNGSCSACFYFIPEQDMIMLRQKKLLQCKSCYRFLYLELPEESKESEGV